MVEWFILSSTGQKHLLYVTTVYIVLPVYTVSYQIMAKYHKMLNFVLFSGGEDGGTEGGLVLWPTVCGQ